MKKENQKVKLSEKIGMLMVCAGNIPLMTLLSLYFMIYYTTVVGLDPKALATLFLISLLLIRSLPVQYPASVLPLV